jgi:hypothetical protein
MRFEDPSGRDRGRLGSGTGDMGRVPITTELRGGNHLLT